MKTTISIPDSLNDRIQAQIKIAGISRSQFYQIAAEFYLNALSTKEITANLNAVHDSLDPVDRKVTRLA